MKKIDKIIKKARNLIKEICDADISIDDKTKLLNEIITEITNQHIIFIPNWYDKEHFEFFIEKELSEDEYIDLVLKLNDNDALADEITELFEKYLLYIVRGDEQ